MYEENSLEHHGILGMKWGVRRYQNKDGSLTPAGKKRYDDPKSTNDYEAAKQRAIKSGTAQDVLRFRGNLTTQELQAAKQRLDLEQQLVNLDQARIDAGRKKVDNVVNYMQTGVRAANTGIEAWNVVAKVSNTFRGTNMKIIGEKNDKSEGISAKDIVSILKKTKNKDEFDSNLSEYSDAEIAAIQKRVAFEAQIKKNLFNDSSASTSSTDTEETKPN